MAKELWMVSASWKRRYVRKVLGGNPDMARVVYTRLRTIWSKHLYMSVAFPAAGRVASKADSIMDDWVYAASAAPAPVMPAK